MQALAFAAEHESSGRTVVHAIVILLAALVEAIDPEAALLQVFKRASDVGHARDGQVFERAGGGLGHNVGNAGRAPFRNDDRCGACRMRSADDRAEIVRILDAIEDYDELTRRGLLEVRVLARGAERDHALVGGTAGQPVERGALLEADRDGSAPRQVDDLLNARAAGALRDEDSFERAPGFERFDDRMD